LSGLHRITKNILALLTTSATRLLLGIALQLYVARQLGAGGLGKYAVVLAFVTVFQVITELGLSRLVIRELARRREPQRYFYGAVAMQVIGAVVAYGLLAAAVQLLGYKQDTGRALYIAGLSLFPYAVTSACQACFQAMERMELIAAVETAGAAGQLALAVGLLSTGHGVVALGGVIVAGEALVALLCLFVAFRLGFLLPVRFSPAFSWQLARAAPPFFLLAVSVVIYSRLDIIMISQFMGERAAGVYSAAYLIVRALSLGVTAYSDALYPALSRLHTDTSMRERLELAGRKALQYGLVLILPAAAGTAALAPALIHLLYRDQQYTGAVLVLRLVVWETVPFLVNAVLSRLLIASNLQRLSAQVALIKLAVSVVYYAVLIPLFGLPGAAVATVLATATGTGLNLRFVNGHVLPLRLGVLGWKPMLAAGAMAAALFLLPGWNLGGLIFLGALIYFGLLLALRTLAAEDWLLLARLVRPRSVG
jgi:O-antigen/teichoic acid export membrane protein